ncbi:MAG: class I SAM-dependent methyltransferase family protein [Candidatus Thorarchaeota archaeon]
MSDKDPKDNLKIAFIKLKKRNALHFIQFIKDHFKFNSVIDQKYKIEHYENKILFPLVENKKIVYKLGKMMELLIPFELIFKEGTSNPNFKYRTLEEALEGKIPTSYLNLIPRSYDIIGNIAILEFEKIDQINNSDYDEFKNLVASAVIDVNKNVFSVFEKKSEIKGLYRLRDLSYLGGEKKTETVHKENNCFFHLDIKTTYFSPRLVYERRRISESDIKENEIIVDMFSGVGTYSIQIAKLYSVEIHAFDLNPAAYKFLKKNISLNKLKGKIFPYNMNIRDLVNPSNQLNNELNNNVDRIIMNLPEDSIEYIDVACFLMKKSGGILHFYKFSEKPNATEKTLGALKRRLDELNWVIDKIINSKIVKSYSPKAELVVIDLNMKYLNS